MTIQELIIVLSVALFWLLVFYVGGAGVLPLLKELTAYTENKREMARKGIEAVDAYFADSPSVVGNVVHEIAGGLQVSAADPMLIKIAESQLATEIAKMVNLALPQTADRLTAEVLADVLNDTLGILGRITDNVKGNALTNQPPNSILPPIGG